MTNPDLPMRTEWIAPTGTGRVLHPDGRPLADDGERVTWSTYWARRLRDGDIVIVSPEQEPS